MIYFDNLKKQLKREKFPAYRAKQIIHSVFKEGVGDFNQIKNIPSSLIQYLNKNIQITTLKAEKVLNSKNGSTTKCLFLTSDSEKIESVLMKFKDKRNTVCVSSQVGCQLGCKFCATGTMKFGRNLSSDEICDQVLYFHQELISKGKRITNIVFMGMGEPFMNYENVLNSIKTINDNRYFNIGARNITVSTSGIAPAIKEIAKEKTQIKLAVSLHAPNQSIREKIMPIAKKYKMDELMESIEYYLKLTNRRITYEYLMLRGINDSNTSSRELADLLKHQLCHVNLIPYNATDIPGISGSDKKRIDSFRKIIDSAGIPVTVRVSLGQDIQAACGQLANKS
jgi:23S rRNA (adenine2503-C2)-methyltransferase